MTVAELSRLPTIADYQAMGWGDRAADFHAWMHKIDLYCIAYAGVGVMDLPDQDYASAFEAGEHPRDIAREILLEEGFDI